MLQFGGLALAHAVLSGLAAASLIESWDCKAQACLLWSAEQGPAQQQYHSSLALAHAQTVKR